MVWVNVDVDLDELSDDEIEAEYNSHNHLLGYVREDKREGHGFTPYTNLSEGRAQFPTQSTLKEAKDMLLAHFVLQKLEEE